MRESESLNRTGRKASLEVLHGIPMVVPGDNLGAILEASVRKSGITIENKDIFVVTQKIVSKAEGRYRSLVDYTPTTEALKLSQTTGKDARLVQLILEESDHVQWVKDGTPENPGLIVVKHRLGHSCSGAGIDATNTGSSSKDEVLLLPEDPDKSAKDIAEYFYDSMGVKIGVVIIDTLGDSRRYGSIGKAIGVANVPARQIETGLSDLDGKPIVVADVAVADSIAGLAMLVMGNPDQGCPVVHIRGVDYSYSPTARMTDVLH